MMDNLPPVLVSVNRFNAEEYLIRDPTSVGRSIIINNDKFNDNGLYPSRYGSSGDVKLLQEVFEDIGFNKTEVIESEDKDGIISRLKDIARDPAYTTQVDVFMCVILSYGKYGYFYDRDGHKVFLCDILEIFNGRNCPGLVLKPKIFIMQVCDKTVTHKYDKAMFGFKPKLGDISKHPLEADFLTYTSTISGFHSWTENHHTKFIESICRLLRENKMVDFSKLIINVNAEMDCFISSLTNLGEKLELPLCTSQLTKHLVLCNGKEDL